MREVRVSPDRQQVAIRGNAAAEEWNAWGVFDALHGGYWCASDEVQSWAVLDVPAAEPQPEPVIMGVVLPPPPVTEGE